MYTFICICTCICICIWICICTCRCRCTHRYIFTSHGIHAIVSNSANKIPVHKNRSQDDPKIPQEISVLVERSEFPPECFRGHSGSGKQKGRDRVEGSPGHRVREGQGHMSQRPCCWNMRESISTYMHTYKHTKIHRYYMMIWVCIYIYTHISLYIYIYLFAYVKMYNHPSWIGWTL